MNPIAQKLDPRGKAVTVCAFAFAAVAAGVGLFTPGPLQLFSQRLPPGSVPLLVFVLLAVGVVSARRALGAEQCRRCRRPIERRSLGFSPNDEGRVIAAVEAGDAGLLGDLAPLSVSTQPGTESREFRIVVDLGHCPECRNVATLCARRIGPEGAAEIVAEHVILGPDVAAWIARG